MFQIIKQIMDSARITDKYCDMAVMCTKTTNKNIAYTPMSFTMVNENKDFIISN